ncbi:MAG: hypothetical protein Tsb0016_13650 [Sphingomonadales bacterium]
MMRADKMIAAAFGLWLAALAPGAAWAAPMDIAFDFQTQRGVSSDGGLQFTDFASGLVLHARAGGNGFSHVAQRRDGLALRPGYDLDFGICLLRCRPGVGGIGFGFPLDDGPGLSLGNLLFFGLDQVLTLSLSRPVELVSATFNGLRGHDRVTVEAGDDLVSLFDGYPRRNRNIAIANAAAAGRADTILHFTHFGTGWQNDFRLASVTVRENGGGDQAPAVAEPAMLSLFGLGLAGLAVVRRRV